MIFYFGCQRDIPCVHNSVHQWSREYLECSSTSVASQSSHGYCEHCIVGQYGSLAKEADISRDRRVATYDRIEKIRNSSNVASMDYMWSCHFNWMRETTPAIQHMCDDYWPYPKTPKNFIGKTNEDIATMVEFDELQV